MNNHSLLGCDAGTHAKSALVIAAFAGTIAFIGYNVTHATKPEVRSKAPMVIHLPAQIPAPKIRQTPVKQYISPPPAPIPTEPSRPEKVITRGFAGLSTPSIVKS